MSSSLSLSFSIYVRNLLAPYFRALIFVYMPATLYELRSTVGLEKKKELLVEVAKWSGDGLKTNSLKLPAN